MPFRSKAQQRWMFKFHPEWAKEWAEGTDWKNLPERVIRQAKKRKVKK